MRLAGVLRAIAQAGGAVLWANGARSYEEALQLCALRLDDASRASGDAFGRVLGDLVAASKSPAAVQAVCTLSNARQAVSWQSHRQTCVSAMEPEGSSQCSLQLLVPSRAALASLQHFDRPPMSVIRTAMQKP